MKRPETLKGSHTLLIRESVHIYCEPFSNLAINDDSLQECYLTPYLLKSDASSSYQS
jgi:hypothetical protein